jgi:Recombinase
MAAEYSRELGLKVFAAEKRWAELGFKQGGAPGYALRRLMISSNGSRKQLLGKGEVKFLQSDRVILIPGDPEEVRCVREMYRMLVEERRTPFEIARELNRRGLTHQGAKWRHQNVYRILTHPKYAGWNVLEPEIQKTGWPANSGPEFEVDYKTCAFEPVIDSDVFKEAQSVLAQRTSAKSNDKILEDLRTLLAKKGTLTHR